MPRPLRATRFRRLMPWAVLATVVAGPAGAQTVEADARLMDQVARCHATVHGAPREALAIATQLLATPALPVVVEIGAEGCRGFASQLLGQGDASLESAARLQALLRTPGLPAFERGRALQMAATLLQRNGQTTEGLQLLESMLERGIAEGDVGSQITALTGIALIRGEQMDDPEGALHYLQQALALSDHLRRPPLPQDVMLHYNHGYTLLRLKRHDEAERAFARAESIAGRVSSQDVMLHRIRGHRAEIQHARGRLEAARAQFLAILPWQAKNDPLGQIVTLQRLARIALEQQQPRQARELGEQALALAETGKFPEATRDSLDILAETSVALGDTAQARDYLRQARQIDQARMKGDDLNRLARLQATAEKALDPARINAVQEASRDRLLRNAALAAALILLLGGGALYLRMRRQQRQLRRLGTIDALTGLPNRREAQRLLDAAMSARTGEARSAVLLLEIDGFKALNDLHGHAAGDLLLRAVAEELVRGSDQHDHVARWGGATFVVIRANTSQAAAFALAAHLCRRIERLQVDVAPGQCLTPSLSAGVAPHPLFPGATANQTDTLRAVSRALQVARRSGVGTWAGLWGLADGRTVDLYSILRDPEHALAQGWIAIGGGRPMSWAPPRELAAAPARDENRGPNRMSHLP
ncbi:diguanylate cyclase [Stenotrophomonas acidaminiphila]|uniref:GGDEF domain-containing protein n=1 Tax=Stenotrophomonas acidaminiphila TaxID=128780 RepID=UPI002ABD6D30|nr:diguanylate cyclase [Stenotrophomonas acidaminiphila]WPU55944.1 diguanylate cyclase [Stenotrophomonas acidaminiphila]